MSGIQPLAILGGLTAAATGAVSRVTNGGNAFLQALAGNDPSAKPAAPEPTEDELKQQLELKLKDIADRIRDRLKQAGINIAQPIELEVSPTGGVQVVGEHPDMVRIEAVLNETSATGAELADLLEQGSGGSLSLTNDDATITPSLSAMMQ